MTDQCIHGDPGWQLTGQLTGHILLIVWSLYLRSCYLHDSEGTSFSAKLGIRMYAAPSTFRPLQCDALRRYP